MPGSLALVLLGAVVHGLAGLVPRAPGQRHGTAAAAAGILGSLLALAGALGTLLGGGAAAWAGLGWPAFRLDPVSALMIAAVSIPALAVSIDRLGETGTDDRTSSPWTGLFLAGLLLALVADDALSLFGALLVTAAAACLLIATAGSAESEVAARRFGLTCLGGSALTGLALLLLAGEAHAVSFRAWRAADLSGSVAAPAFVLGLLGFGALAGLMPMHGGLVRQAGVTSAPVAALLSGAWSLLGLYGIARLGFDLLGPLPAWCGWLALLLGAGSVLFGALDSCIERDLRRLLAYATVANLGIILVGLGIGLVGRAQGQATLATLGLMAALYHALNHAVVRALLCLNAGAVGDQVGSHDLDRMGGLARAMPWTAATGFVGVLGVAALPPLNGFVSEWFTFQALFQAALAEGDLARRLLAPLTMVLLGLAGGLTVMGFVKSFGIAFLGTPRSARAHEAREVAPARRYVQAGLAVGCVLLGLGAPRFAPLVRTAAASVAGGTPEVAGGLAVFAADPALGVASPATITLLLAGLLAVPLGLAALNVGERPPRKNAREIWATGYAPEAAMHVSSVGFTEPIRAMFRPAFRLRGTPTAPALRPTVVSATSPAAAAALAGSRAELAAVEPAPRVALTTAAPTAPGGTSLTATACGAAIGLFILFGVAVAALTLAGGR